MPYNSLPYLVNQPIPATYPPATRTPIIATNPMASNIVAHALLQPSEPPKDNVSLVRVEI
jgi:hypothetical protein